MRINKPTRVQTALRAACAASLAISAAVWLSGCSAEPAESASTAATPDSPATSAASAPATPATAAPATDLDTSGFAEYGGLIASSGENQLDIWVDYQCSHCRDFERVNGERVAQLAEENTTVRIHPLYFLDRGKAHGPSLTAANALACVASKDTNQVLPFWTKLLERSTLSTDWIVDAAATFGVTDIEACVDSEQYQPWLEAAMTAAFDGNDLDKISTELEGIEGTPTIVLNGAVYTGDLTDDSLFNAFVTKHLKAE